MKNWMPVDLYIGGMEHAVGHLMYSRFFTKVLHEKGYVDFDEPFTKLRNQGMILAEDGQKMSKRWGNVINPDDVVRELGADTMRLYEMFMGPLSESKPWDTKGIIGVRRFLEKVWNLKLRITNEKLLITDDKIARLLHKTIKKVTEDIEALRFNTAISAMMILVNEMEKEEQLLITNYELLIILLSVFAPHITEELWSQLGHKASIFHEKWPKYDPELIKDETYSLVVQVNGKLRATISVNVGVAQEEVEKLAKADGHVQEFLSGKEIKKVIFVKDKLINFVV